MRRRLAIFSLLLAALYALPASAITLADGMNAANVLGQANFTSGGTATTQSGMSNPYGAAYDATNQRLFVPDSANNRVLVFDAAAIADGENAVNVLGQANFTSSGAAATQSGMTGPTAVAYDATNQRLFVSDSANSRVLVYDFTGGVTWTARTSAADNNWYGVTYGNGLFVAVAATGTGNRVMTSPDGIAWTARTSVADNQWLSVTYGNGLFVAVAATGTGNRVMTSPDGITWTARTSAADNDWTSVTYGNGLFVAVAYSGTGNRVMTSPDGIDWTARTSAADNAWISVTYGNGLFVAVAFSGTGNRVMTSPDGIAWTARTSVADNQWLSVTYGNGLFVAVANTGTGNRVMTSPDGITWTARTSAADNDWHGVTYGNGLFVAVAHSGTGNRVMTSPDGIAWTARTSAADNNWYGVTYGNGLFVAVAATGTGNRVMTSGGISNGMNVANVLGQANFTSSSAATTQAGMNAPYGVAYDATNQRLFVSEYNNNRSLVYDFTGGVTWTSRTSAADNDWLGVTYGNGLFVAVSQDGIGNRVMTSPDGITWTARTSAADNSWTSVTYGNNLFVAVAGSGTGNRVMTSPDGITWTSRTSAADNSWLGVTYGNNLFVAVANSGIGNRVMTSPDGITWTIRTSAADNSWLGVTYGSGLFVAVGNSGIGNRVMTSPDGITWTSRTSAADNAWRGVTYGNGLFVAVSQDGIGNRVMTSPDGITWTIRTSAVDNQWFSVTYGNGLFVAVAATTGTGNRVMTSGGISDGMKAANVLGQANFTSSGAATTQSGMRSPVGSTYDSTGQRLFVGDNANHRVLVFDVAAITNGESAANVLGQANFTSSGAATTQTGMNGPYGAAYDATNQRLFVGDTANNRTLVFDVAAINNGENAVNVLGQADFTSSSAATTQSGMVFPAGAAYDATDKRLFVGTATSNRVLVFNLTASGGGCPAPSITVAKPNGGERFSFGTSELLFWTSQGCQVIGTRLSLSADGGASYPSPIADGAFFGQGYYFWKVPDMNTATARIKAELLGYGGVILASDASDADFAVVGTPPPPPASDASQPTAGPPASEPMFTDSATDTFPVGTNDPVPYSAAEKAAPPTDPNSTGTYDAVSAASSTPTIDVDKSILPPSPEKRLPCVGGSLIKIARASDVYYCGKDGKRYVFPNEQIYFSWFDDFGGVTTISAEEMAATPIGGNVTYKPGIRMIKIQTDTRVYALARNGSLRWVKNEAAAARLYGPDWNRNIDDVPDSFFVNYKLGEMIE